MSFSDATNGRDDSRSSEAKYEQLSESIGLADVQASVVLDWSPGCNVR